MKKKVAIVHYWLTGMRGGESVIEELCEIFPSADIFTHVYDPLSVSDIIRSRKVHTTFINKLPRSKKAYHLYLPLMPIALECLDLSEYDLVISSESGPAKGVITHPDSLHICYTHSPMRYIWDQYNVYHNEAGFITKLLMPLLSNYLRIWDVTSSARVDRFIANSNHVSRRISKYYRRPSTVIAPPVDIKKFSVVPKEEIGDYYLWAGELVSYKQPSIAIEAFTRLNKKLMIIGNGKLPKKITDRAGDNVIFLGRVSDSELARYMSRCIALVFPGEEDFGIVPIEVMASGRPVIAYGKGGALDTVIDKVTGTLFYEQNAKGLESAVLDFEKTMMATLDPNRIRAHAEKFGKDIFKRNIINFVKKSK